jgi:hypothetical protein
VPQGQFFNYRRWVALQERAHQAKSCKSARSQSFHLHTCSFDNLTDRHNLQMVLVKSNVQRDRVEAERVTERYQGTGGFGALQAGNAGGLYWIDSSR